MFIDTKIFIAKARTIHGNKYSYSKSRYRNYHKKVIIICPEHGSFRQSPAKHLLGRGCPKCANITRIKYLTKRKRLEDFIKEANIIHNNKYTYFNTVYTTSKQKVTITCPIHGDFQQKPDSHISGRNGCPKCGHLASSKSHKFSTAQFIEKANLVHKNQYLYNLVVYSHNQSEVSIICPIHGVFKQKPIIHLSGSGCQRCARKTKLNTQDFIADAKYRHKKLKHHYNYDKVVYIHSKAKVIITCPIHGDFEQRAVNHLRGCGCPKCSRMKK